MRRPKAVSIYSIGAEAGVSASTVSRALNNHPAVSSALREKIRHIAKGYAFKPSYISNRVLNICVLVQQLYSHPLDFGPYLALVFEGITEYCTENQLEMSIFGATAEELNRKDSVRELRRRGANGAVVLRATSESHYLGDMLKQGFPYYGLFHHGVEMEQKAFSVDNKILAETAVNHLLQLGHRQIGIITDSTNFKHQQQRLQGFYQALQNAGVAVDPAAVFTFSEESSTRPTHAGQLGIGMDGIRELIRRSPSTTAVFCTTDLIAEGALCGLHDKGIIVPRQISIIGLDDYPSSAYFCPPLTTIRVPIKEIAYEAARQVHLQCLEIWDISSSTVLTDLKGELIVRRSTAPPPSSR